jgi:hypothetical protein
LQRQESRQKIVEANRVKKGEGEKLSLALPVDKVSAGLFEFGEISSLARISAVVYVELYIREIAGTS